MKQFVLNGLRSAMAWRGGHEFAAALVDGLVTFAAATGPLYFSGGEGIDWRGILCVAGGVLYAALRAPLRASLQRDHDIPSETVLIEYTDRLQRLGKRREKRVRVALAKAAQARRDGKVPSWQAAFDEIHHPAEDIEHLLTTIYLLFERSHVPSHLKSGSIRLVMTSHAPNEDPEFTFAIPSEDTPSLKPRDLLQDDSGYAQCVQRKAVLVWEDVMKAVTDRDLIQSPTFAKAGQGSLMCAPIMVPDEQAILEGRGPDCTDRVGYVLSIFVPLRGSLAKSKISAYRSIVNRLEARLSTQHALTQLRELCVGREADAA